MNVKTKIQDPMDIILSAGDISSLTVRIGNIQVGGSIVQFADQPDILAKGTITNLQLGDGGILKNRALKVTTNVLDRNPATLNISVKHLFDNGNPAVQQLADTVDNAGDVYSWVTTY